MAQTGQGLAVNGTALALLIGPIRAAGRAAFIPIQPQPKQILLQLLGIGWAAAGRVQIFYAQHHHPVGGPAGEPGHQGTKGIAQVHPGPKIWPDREIHRPFDNKPLQK